MRLGLLFTRKNARISLYHPPPPPPPPTPNLTGRSTHIDLISSPLSTEKTGLCENNVFTFYTILLAV